MPKKYFLFYILYLAPKPGDNAINEILNRKRKVVNSLKTFYFNLVIEFLFCR